MEDDAVDGDDAGAADAMMPIKGDAGVRAKFALLLQAVVFSVFREPRSRNPSEHTGFGRNSTCARGGRAQVARVVFLIGTRATRPS